MAREQLERRRRNVSNRNDYDERNQGHSEYGKNPRKGGFSFAKTIFKSISITLGVMCVLAIATALFLFYGPYHQARDLWVTTAMTTINHKYLATLFFSDETIEGILSQNRVDEVNETTDPSLIKGDDNPSNPTKGEKGVELIDVSRNGFKAWLLKIDDPAKVSLSLTSKYKSMGETIMTMAERNNSLAAINAGGFVDADGKGNGGNPYGLVVRNGEYILCNANTKYEVIGFTEDGILTVDKLNKAQMQQVGIRDAVSFGPVLIKNGKSSVVHGNGGWGIAPRTAIGQTADKTVLMLVVDGRQANSTGAALTDVIDIMLEYGAINAANLDGGSSASLYYEGAIVNKPCSGYENGLRPVATSFIVDK